jgi:hypothetical protein
MKTIGSVVGAPLKALGLVKKPGKAPAPLPTPTRDDVVDRMASEDELRRRRGGAADILTGQGGAEAAPSGGKQTLGS